MSYVEEVRVANEAFYAAHEARDFAAMSAVWNHGDGVVCVHPGWPILRGWEAVQQSWRQIFAGPGRNQFLLTNVSIAVSGELAWVTLEENLVAGAEMAAVAATNVFALQQGEWGLVNHHGSPIMTSG